MNSFFLLKSPILKEGISSFVKKIEEIMIFDDFYNPPEWALGKINQDDAAFLVEMIFLTSPKEVIEIGVASGCSSAVILSALNQIDKASKLSSFDIMHQCYFAPDRPVGAAVMEMVPNLSENWSLFCGEGACDAAQRYRERGVQLAFIDADHRHPWPTLDALALLPALAGSAWIVLHDIVLPQISDFKVFGAQCLFNEWPGEKRRSVFGQGNIGAIRLPGEREVAEKWLRDILRIPWQADVEIGVLESLKIRSVASWKKCIEEAYAVHRSIIIWGAGSSGRACLREIKGGGLNPAAFIDSDEEKTGAEIEGITVYGPDFLRSCESRPFVIIASVFAPEIEAALRALDFKSNVDFIRFSGAVGFSQGVGLLGMTTVEEQNYLESWARNSYKCAGRIVDLGCWLGSTTVSLATGLGQRGEECSNVIDAYDTFIWQSWMDPYAGELTGQFRSGESFLCEFMNRIRGYESKVKVHVKDLTDTQWDGGPIEFLLIDAMKSWDLCLAIYKVFLSHVISGSGLVMHQDFKFWGCPWIHLTMFKMKDHFLIEKDLSNSPGTVFRLVQHPSESFLHDICNAETYSVDDIAEAYAFWRRSFRGNQVYLLDCAHVLALCQIGENEKALRILRCLQSNANSVPSVFMNVLDQQFPGLFSNTV